MKILLFLIYISSFLLFGEEPKEVEMSDEDALKFIVALKRAASMDPEYVSKLREIYKANGQLQLISCQLDVPTITAGSQLLHPDTWQTMDGSIIRAEGEQIVYAYIQPLDKFREEGDTTQLLINLPGVGWRMIGFYQASLKEKEFISIWDSKYDGIFSETFIPDLKDGTPGIEVEFSEFHSRITINEEMDPSKIYDPYKISATIFHNRTTNEVTYDKWSDIYSELDGKFFTKELSSGKCINL